MPLTSASLLSAVFQHLPDGVFLIDPHTSNILDCNQAALDQVGLARHEAEIVTREALAATKPPAAPSTLSVTFNAPTARRYDTANALEACKPYIDGICDALGIDDSVFVSVCCERAAPNKDSAGVTLKVQ